MKNSNAAVPLLPHHLHRARFTLRLIMIANENIKKINQISIFFVFLASLVDRFHRCEVKFNFDTDEKKLQQFIEER